MARSHGTKLKILVSKLRSGTYKTKAGALYLKSHCATSSPVCVILYHVTRSCKGPIVMANIMFSCKMLLGVGVKKDGCFRRRDMFLILCFTRPNLFLSSTPC